MIENQTSKHFSSALSFPGEYRILVEAISEKLTKLNSAEMVLYGQYHKAEFVRPNLDTSLQKSRMVGL